MSRDRKDVPLRNLRTYGKARAVRLEGCNYSGDEVVHLTICAKMGNPFGDERAAEVVTRSVEFYADRFDYELYGYCLMPDHLHVLISPANTGVPIWKWLQAFKSYTAKEATRILGTRMGWQRSAYDHVCRKTETAESVLRYLANNPVRAGFVECWTDWRWTKVFIEI